MKKLLYTLVTAAIAIGCEPTPNDKTSDLITLTGSKDTIKGNKDTLKTLPANQVATSENWMAILLKNYITHSDKELIRLAIKSKGKEEWLFDQVIDTDTAKYYVFQIGHDVSEEKSSELRFITDQWIYIDSLTRKLYEYDLPNERLTEWKKQPL